MLCFYLFVFVRYGVHDAITDMCIEEEVRCVGFPLYKQDLIWIINYFNYLHRSKTLRPRDQVTPLWVVIDHSIYLPACNNKPIPESNEPSAAPFPTSGSSSV